MATSLQSNSTLIHLDLRYNEIREAGSQSLATSLQFNSALVHLDLRHNRIKDAGAQHLATVLLSNSTLTYLDLGYNRIGTVGTQRLAIQLNFDSFKLEEQPNWGGRGSAFDPSFAIKLYSHSLGST